MGLFSFDWSQIAYIASPLVVPWWAQLNIFGGFFVAFWIIAPIMYYTNVRKQNDARGSCSAAQRVKTDCSN